MKKLALGNQVKNKIKPEDRCIPKGLNPQELAEIICSVLDMCHVLSGNWANVSKFPAKF